MKVSVITPAFRPGEALTQALESVAQQHELTAGIDFEVVVADDGCDDPASAAALERARTQPWVRVVKTSGRCGPATARNLAAGQARGRWLAFLDADDLLTADALATRLRACAAHPEVVVAGTDYCHFSGQPPARPDLEPGLIRQSPRRNAAVRQALDNGQPLLLTEPLGPCLTAIPFYTSSVMLRRDVFERLGGFPVRHRIGEDNHLWLRAMACGALVFVPRITACCRIGHASLSRREQSLNLQAARCLEELTRDPLLASVRPRLQVMVADAYAAESYEARQRHRHLHAAAMALQAMRWTPTRLTGWRALTLSAWPTNRRAGT